MNRYTVDGINYASVFHMKPKYGLRPPKRIFHETGPEQSSRADNRCIRLQMMLRIFFVLTIIWEKHVVMWILRFYCVLPIEIDFQQFVFI